MMNQLYFTDFSDEQILAHPDIKQRILMMTGQKKDKKLELTKEQEKQIAKNFNEMLVSLMTLNWCRGGTLGAAEQKALDQMSSFVKSKSNPEHPMNKYLHAMDNQCRREVSERIMTDEHSDEKIGINSELAQRWAKIATEKFKKALKNMNDMYKEFMPQKQIEDKTKKFEKGKENTQQMLLLWQLQQQMSNGRAA